jgi:hypothetical protein
MVGIPLLILGLAAGIFLLMKATSEYMGKLFKVLAWVVIVLSLLGIFVATVHGLRHMRQMHRMQMMHKGMGQNERIIIRESGDVTDAHADSMANRIAKQFGIDGAMHVCCKAEGDSMTMDEAMCEKMMGKEACEKMIKERGRCIMSKEECAKVCGTGGAAPACCMGAGNGEIKECCKKK